jgi:hypothetical protein
VSRCKTLFSARKNVYTVCEAKQSTAPADKMKIEWEEDRHTKIIKKGNYNEAKIEQINSRYKRPLN